MYNGNVKTNYFAYLKTPEEAFTYAFILYHTILTILFKNIIQF